MCGYIKRFHVAIQAHFTTLSGRFLNDRMDDHGVDYCYLVIVLSKLLTVFQASPSLFFHVGMHTSGITLHLVSIKPNQINFTCQTAFSAPEPYKFLAL